MTNEIKNVPELRFPEFKEEWVEKKLGEITSKISDGIHSTPTYDSNGDIYFINGNNLVNGRIDFKTSKKISVQEFNKYKNYLEAKNTLLLSINGTIGNIAKYEGENILLGKSAAYINVVSKFISRCYIFYYLQTSKIYESFLRELTGTTIKNLSLKSIKNIIVYISELDEQQKIGNFFSKLDRQIELEEQKLEKLEEQKKGYMQKIFSQELRFKDENGQEYPAWINKKLGDIGKVSMNKRIYKNETSINGEIPFYKIGTFGKEAETFISREKFEEYKNKYPYPEKGDILISASGSIGRTIEYDGEEAYYQDSNIVWLDHNDEVLNIFLKYIYSVIKWSGIEGTTIKRLYNKDILNTKIDLPVIKEQEKIGNFFGKIDDSIEKQSSKIGVLKQRKKGFLQKMFV